MQMACMETKIAKTIFAVKNNRLVPQWNQTTFFYEDLL